MRYGGLYNENFLQNLYGDLGDGFLTALNGWFCGVLIDLRLNRITLFNDRFGMSRIYLHEGNEEFLFASEAKALLKIRPALRAIEPEAMAEQLRFNCLSGRKTLFKGISRLPNASSWVFENNVRPQKNCYFAESEWENLPTVAAEDF